MCTIRVRIVLWENLSHLTRFPQGTMGQGFELRTAAQASVAERFSSRVAKKEKQHDPSSDCAVFGDPWENRTPVSALRGPCLSRLTNGPFVVAEVGFEPTTCRV